MPHSVQTTLQDGVVTLTMNQPESLNALGPALMQALLPAFQAAACDPATRAIVLTGAGKAFSAGGDITWFGQALALGPAHTQVEISRVMAELGNPLTLALAECPVPVVAAVNGPCVGGAIGLALAADVVLAARSAYFLVPQVAQLGVVPDLGATWHLSRLLGRSRALSMALLGDRIDAGQAEQWGLVWRCVDDADLAAQAQTIAKRLGRAPATVTRDTRQLIDAASATALAQQLEAERVAQCRHVANEFFNQACTRFLATAGRT